MTTPSNSYLNVSFLKKGGQRKENTKVTGKRIEIQQWLELWKNRPYIHGADSFRPEGGHDERIIGTLLSVGYPGIGTDTKNRDRWEKGPDPFPGTFLSLELYHPAGTMG